MKKPGKRTDTGQASTSDEHSHQTKKGTAGKFNVESADAFQVVDEIVALREALAAMEKRPFSAASRAPVALRRLLEVIENINLRVADLESGN